MRAPQFSDEERTRRAWVVHCILWSTLLVWDSQFPVAFLLLPHHWARWLTSLLTINITFSLLLLLNRRGHPRLAGLLLVATLWILATGMALTGGGIRAPAMMAYVVDVLVAGLLFGAAGGVIGGIVVCMSGLGLVILGWAGRLPVSRVTPTSLSLWVNLVFYIELMVVFQFLANRSIKSALAQARRELRERKQAEIALRQSRDNLEARVQERTAELQAANKELEAFSYSVSHDLRGPLRSVLGYADLFASDYAENLPGDAQTLLTGIKTSALRMNQLIDDLLNLSRASSRPMACERVDLTALSRQTIQELQAANPGRDLDIRLADLPDCTGDPAWLRQVFVNLISNAIKFSGNRPVALIEIGFKTQGPETIYYVRDNGVGFDMQYAGKLFGVFQRLHSAADFTGTGVGLSIVQRIIQRHGGRIWAEAAVDQGAAFYFTLPEPEP